MASSTEKKLALVTGSTSGIGESIAYALASKGMEIVINGFGTEERIRAVQEECQSRGAPHVEYCSADLMDARQIEAMFSEIKEKFGKTPDVLVNNAGKIQCLTVLQTRYNILLCRAATRGSIGRVSY